MATTQYIGARYVPLFYTNPDDNSNNWKSGVAYDPLTVVTDLNQSYTSKIPVPASVGRPSENSAYWILTGQYNAQVQQLSQDVDDLREEVRTIYTRGRNYILIGDSYGAGVNGNGGPHVNGWYKWFETYLKDTDSKVYYHTGETGMHSGNSGFTSSLPFLTMLQDIENFNDFNKDDITDIVVLGGTNDRSGIGSPANIETAIAAFMAYVNTNYPAARVRIGCLTALIQDVYTEVVPEYKKCTLYGAGYITNLLHLFCNTTYIGTDGTHLTAAGYEFYSPYIANEILVGDVDYAFEIATSLTARTNFEWVDAGAHRLLITVRPRDYNFQFMQSQSYAPLRIKVNNEPASAAGTNVRPCDIGDMPRMHLPSAAIGTGFFVSVSSTQVDLNRFGRLFIGIPDGETAPVLQANLDAYIGPSYSGYHTHYLYFACGAIANK